MAWAGARTDRDPAIRRRAMFWLGQSDDPRARALFAEVLLGQAEAGATGLLRLRLPVNGVQ